MFRQILFQIHWFLGITAGILLAIIGVTGAMMSFEGEIMVALSRNESAVVQKNESRLTVPQLVTRFYEDHPQNILSALIVDADPKRMAQAKYAVGVYDERALQQKYLDPYDGKLLGETVGRSFFAKVREIHRWMLLPDLGETRTSIGPGRWVTMITAISLIFFALSGLYLRWPRRPLDWRSWFKLDFKMTGRNFFRSLHAVIGSWVLIAYLFSAVTGLWWSFGDLTSWYRDAVAMVLTGKPYIQGDGDGGTGLPRDISMAWAGFESVKPDRYQSVTIEIRNPTAPIRFRVLPIGAPHDRAWDVIRVDAATGKVLSQELYGQRQGKDIPLGEFIVTSFLALHTGGFFGIPGRTVLMITSVTMPLFTVTGLLMYFNRRSKKKALQAIETGEPVAGDGSLLVVYASQTRTAERLARQTAAAFSHAGRPVDVISVDRLVPADLIKAKTALFIASTYGDGEPPDSARGFARRYLSAPLKLDGLAYATLALGDREYPQFCSFGHRIDQWLHSCGARRLFDTLEVNGEEEAPLETWRQGIATLGAASEAVKMDCAVYERCRLVERTLLNPGSLGLPAFHVALEPVDGFTSWEAGDIAAILPGDVSPGSAQVTAHEREYSIASTPEMGRIEFIVRQVQKDDGRLGLGSGWLTKHAAVGDEVHLRLRANPAFRAPAESCPVILIGNGTGLAGLLAHIRQRIGRDAAPMWLLFGERSRAHDRFHAEELDSHLVIGTLARMDYAFSRDAGDGRYVQDLVSEAGEDIRRWVADGAAIYVCGSLKGMAPAVDRCLRDLLGDQRLDELTDTGLYRRDIY